MYIHNKIVSAETYIEYVTGCHHDLKRPDQIEEMAEIMEQTGNDELWDYALDEIEHVLENDTPVVLVDIYGTTMDDSTMHHLQRWYELPDDNSNYIQEKFNKIENRSKEGNV